MNTDKAAEIAVRSPGEGGRGPIRLSLTCGTDRRGIHTYKTDPPPWLPRGSGDTHPFDLLPGPPFGTIRGRSTVHMCVWRANPAVLALSPKVIHGPWLQDAWLVQDA